MTPGGIPLLIRLNQYDSDFSIVFTLYSSDQSWTLESGTTAKIRGTKKSGTGYSADATVNVSNSTVTIAGDQQMTAVAGLNTYEVVLYDGELELSSANFFLYCEQAAMSTDTITDDTVLAEITDFNTQIAAATAAANRAEAAADSVTIDPTLSQSGQAADAKVVGDKFDQIKKTFATFSNDLYNASGIASGEIVQTNGYYSENDGGGSLYLITDTSSSYSISLNHGLYANVIESQNVNAGAYGAIGQKDVSYARKAIGFAGSIGANIYFPSDINIGGGLEFGAEFNNRTITFYGNVTYRGSLYAITLHNTKSVTVRGNELECTAGSGIQILQDGEYTLYNTNVFFAYINAHIDGLRITAKTWGIYECLIHIDKINSRYYGLRCEALESSAETSSFVGQMKYEFQHMVSSETYAISFNAATNTTITGVLIDGLSLEGSHNGIQLRGDCKLFKILNVRALEFSSFTWLVNATGDLRFNRFSFISPPKTDQLYISATQPEVVEPMVIEGGIYSPAQYRFADKAIYYNSTTVYSASNNNVYQKSENFTFGTSNATYRCYKNFINNSGSELTYDVLGYFSPFGVDEIFVTQNKNSGSVSIVKVGNRTIFDGNNETEDGETTYKITAMYDPSLGTTIYKIHKL